MTDKTTKKPTIKKVTAAKKVTKVAAAPKKTATPKATAAAEKKTKTVALAKNSKKEENIEVKAVSDKKVKIIKTKTAKSKDNSDKTYATGKRKNAIAKVWLKKGSGKITINGEEPRNYLKRDILVVVVNEALKVTDTQDKYDVICTTLGGGLSGQAEAIRLGIARALNILNPEAYRKDLKVAGLLTRDSREVERKKPGLKKARKGQVFSKR